MQEELKRQEEEKAEIEARLRERLAKQSQELLSVLHAQASTEAPKKDEAEEGYAKIEEELGGRAGIEQYAAKSQTLEKEIKRRMGNKEPWRQDVIFHHEGLQALINMQFTIHFKVCISKISIHFNFHSKSVARLMTCMP